jgi:hypothetical protein
MIERPKRLVLRRVTPARPSFRSVALVIGDHRLETVLQELSKCIIEREINNANFVPKRSEVRDRIAQLKNKAHEFETALDRLCEVALELPADRMNCLSAIRQALRDVVIFSDNAKSMISSKGGAPKALLGND